MNEQIVIKRFKIKFVLKYYRVSRNKTSNNFSHHSLTALKRKVLIFGEKYSLQIKHVKSKLLPHWDRQNAF